MSLPKNILYPVDFSDRCRAVWPVVVDMAKRLGVPVTLLHGLDIDLREPPTLPGELDSIRQRVQLKLDQFPAAALEFPNVRREVAEGRPAMCIVDRAARMEAPLIMMPTRGHTRFRQLLLGSVTAAVLHDATCPVWTEAHTESQAARAPGYHSLVCAVDMGPQTPALLQTASEFSRQFGASLHVVHSVPHGDGRFSTGLSNRAHALLVDTAREDFSLHCQKAGLSFPLEIVDDFRLVDGIVGAIATHNADLLLIGRGVIQSALGRLRTNAHDLIRCSPCPVLSV